MDLHSAQQARQGDAAWLAAALQDSRRETLATFARYEAALGAALAVPMRAELNPPLWELGHIGWFQSWWLARNPQRERGADADPLVPRAAAARAEADALYDSSNVPHDSRWSLPLPDAQATRADLAAQLEQTLQLLDGAPHDDRALYFHRLVLLHEDMHHEAALYMAQALDLPFATAPPPLPRCGDELSFEACHWSLGHAGAGFAFDNELQSHDVPLAAFRIDTQVRRWADVLPFIEGGGYRDPRWWRAAGREWLASQGADPLPRYLRRAGDGWQQRVGGSWRALDPALPACHLTFFEAEAWCAWTGRRLPTEAEWECAAASRPDEFAWGAVWEWTSSPFAPYPGFVAHPYRDYSAPWFDGRPVLRGASFATQPRLRDARYRNYFVSARNDLFAGLRSCAV